MGYMHKLNSGTAGKARWKSLKHEGTQRLGMPRYLECYGAYLWWSGGTASGCAL